MKTKSIILIFIFFSFGRLSYAQDVEVENHVNTDYTITATYSDGVNYIGFQLDLDAGTNTTIAYDHPTLTNYHLISWRISADLCTPSLDATHTYNVSDCDQITHCTECGSNNAYSSYGISTSPLEHKVRVACKY